MKLPKPSIIQLAVGLLFGLALGMGLIGMLTASNLENLANRGERQEAVVTLRALVEVVEASRAEALSVQDAVVAFAQGDPTIDEVQVIDIKKRQLQASTAADAEEAASLPRRLKRPEKELYDRANDLRAGIEINREEGNARRDEILAEDRFDENGERLEGLALTAPLEQEDGQVTGSVLMSTLPKEGADAAGSGAVSRALLWILGAVALFLLVVQAVKSSPTLPFYAALGIAILALVGFSIGQLGALEEGRRVVEEGVGEHLLQTAELARTTAGQVGVSLWSPEIGAWDVDRFRQPRGLLGTDGQVNTSALNEVVAPMRSRFRNVFGAVSLAGLLLAAFIGLGMAVRTWKALILHREAYFYIVPAMIGMLVLVFFPFSYGVLLSFTNQTLYNIDQPFSEIWVGIDNYIQILSDFDLVRETDGVKSTNYSNFYYTLGFTIVWTVTNVAFGVTLGLVLALILNTKGLVLRPIYRVLLILPWAVPNYITALIWKGMFHQQFGVINQIIQIFGGEPIAWFDTPLTSFITILATNGWLSFPFMMVVALGALQSIPADLYEAARVDGATKWQQFRLVTLPSLKPALVPAIILSVVWTFNMFNIPYLVSSGDPAGATEILVTDSYKIAFEQYRYGYAAAYAVVIFAILLVYGTWQTRYTKAMEGV